MRPRTARSILMYSGTFNWLSYPVNLSKINFWQKIRLSPHNEIVIQPYHCPSSPPPPPKKRIKQTWEWPSLDLTFLEELLVAACMSARIRPVGTAFPSTQDSKPSSAQVQNTLIQRYIEIIQDPLLFSLVLRKEYFECSQRDFHAVRYI